VTSARKTRAIPYFCFFPAYKARQSQKIEVLFYGFKFILCKKEKVVTIYSLYIYFTPNLNQQNNYE